MNKKGFTLIELLAVIVILAIIALIAVPLILNVVADARKGAFKSSVYGIIKASEYTYAKNILNTEPLRELVFEYDDGVETSNIDGYQLEYNGEKPQSGVLIIKKTGEIDLALFDGTYCAKKTYDEIEVTVNEGDAESCITEVEKPSIELVGSNPFYIEINVNNPVIYEDPGVIALNIDESPNNDVTIEVYQEDNLVTDINTSELGEYRVIYIVTDDGKPNQVERIVIIRDTTPPVLTVPASETITTTEVSDYDLMAGVTVTDNSGENISVTVSGSLSIIPGTYIITYRAEDSSDNFVEINRTITVQDIEAPVITILGSNPVTMNVGESYTDTGATALDDVDGDLTEDIVITGSVNPNIPGTYQITYTVTDSSNNTTTATRTINVIDNIPPTVSFGTNGNNIWSRNHSTTVNVTDTHSNIDSSSLRYLITTTSSGITESQITTGFSNGGTINMTTQTGNYYIWILAKDIHGNTTIERSNAFRIDNTPPVISGVVSGATNITSDSFIITRSGNASDAHSGLSTNPYIYQTSTDNSSWTTRCTNNSTSCNVTGLNDDTTYYYRICVVDNVGNQNCLTSKSIVTDEEIFGLLTDTRDNKTYETVKIGGRWWMAENLKYTGSGCLSNFWNSSSLDAPLNSCASFDGEIFYQWRAAMIGPKVEGSQGLCPDGWYIPTDNDWKTLVGTVDSTYGVGSSEWDRTGFQGYDVGTKLKGVEYGGTDNYGFNGLIIGFAYDRINYWSNGTAVHWWTSTPVGDYNPWGYSYTRTYGLRSDTSGVHIADTLHVTGNPVRCIMQQ